MIVPTTQGKCLKLYNGYISNYDKSIIQLSAAMQRSHFRAFAEVRRSGVARSNTIDSLILVHVTGTTRASRHTNAELVVNHADPTNPALCAAVARADKAHARYTSRLHKRTSISDSTTSDRSLVFRQDYSRLTDGRTDGRTV